MTKSELLAELLKAAVENPNFNPLLLEHWNELFNNAETIKENIAKLKQSKSSSDATMHIL